MTGDEGEKTTKDGVKEKGRKSVEMSEEESTPSKNKIKCNLSR